MNNRTIVLNLIADTFKYKSYLEIGVRTPADNFDLINIKNKDGVDPSGKCKYIMTSDEFFKVNTNTYDLIFIDGLHLDNQVTSDFENSLKSLNENGTIVLHDCNPPTEWHQREVYDGGSWNGTAWKAYARLRMSRGDLKMCTIDTDWGLGIIRRGHQIVFEPKASDLNFNFLDTHRKGLLNLTSIDDFMVSIKKEIL